MSEVYRLALGAFRDIKDVSNMKQKITDTKCPIEYTGDKEPMSFLHKLFNPAYSEEDLIEAYEVVPNSNGTTDFMNDVLDMLDALEKVTEEKSVLEIKDKENASKIRKQTSEVRNLKDELKLKDKKNIALATEVDNLRKELKEKDKNHVKENNNNSKESANKILSLDKALERCKREKNDLILKLKGTPNKKKGIGANKKDLDCKVVRQIREEKKNFPKKANKQIAQKFNTSVTAVGRILNNKTYTDC